MRAQPAKEVLEKLERFEKDWSTSKPQSKSKGGVLEMFKFVFPGFDGSSAAMDRIRRAAKVLTTAERQSFTTADATVLYRDVMDLVKDRPLCGKSSRTNATSSESPSSHDIMTPLDPDV